MLLKKGANTNVPVNNELAKYKVLDVKTSKPDNVDSVDNFDGRFFIKINKDDRIGLNRNKHYVTVSLKNQ